MIDIASDGVSDMSIAALTCAGTATLNGSVTLGNSTGDDITVTGSLASTINIKTTATYNIGSATLGLAGVYFGANSQTVRIAPSGSMSATWTLTLPVTAGSAGQVLQTNGSGVSSWAPGQTDIKATSDADYTILDTDGFGVVTCAPAGATDRTITLPTAADNTDRKIQFLHLGAGAGKVIIDGEGAETINGKTTIELYSIYDTLTLLCDGTGWVRLSGEWNWTSYTPTTTNFGSISNVAIEFRRTGSKTCEIRGELTTGTMGASNCTLALPLSLTSSSTSGSTALAGYAEQDISAGTKNIRHCVLATNATSTFTFSHNNSSLTDNPLVSAGGSSTFSNSQRVVMFMSVDVAEWA